MTSRAGETVAGGTAVATGERSQRGLLAAVTLGTTLAPLNSTMVAVALPDISDAFGVGVRDAGWIVVGYLIAMAVTQPIAGKLGDLFGRRGLFLGALAAFAGVTVGAALAPNLPTLIVMRVGMALTSATALPNGAALLRGEVPERRRAAAFGIVGASAGLAAAIGPPVGGALIALGGWQAMFWFNLPVVALALLLAFRSIPKVSVPRAAGRFDFRGAALLAGTLTALALVASAIGDHDEWKIFGLTCAALVMGALFIHTERQEREPLVSFELLRRPAFAAATATIFCSNLAMYAVLLVLPLFLQDLQGLEASEVGLVLGAWTLPVVLLAPVGGRLADRWGRRRPAMIGGVLILAGLAPFLALDAGWSRGVIEGLLVVVGVGMALQMPAIQTSAVEAVDEKDAGMASGVYSMGRYSGSIIGAAVLAAIIGSGAGAKLAEDDLLPVFVMVVIAAAGAVVAPRWLRGRRGAGEMT